LAPEVEGGRCASPSRGRASEKHRGLCAWPADGGPGRRGHGRDPQWCFAPCPQGAGLDATIAADIPSEDVRRAIRQQTGGEPVIEEEPVSRSPPTGSRKPRPPQVGAPKALTGDVGDLALAALLVKGQEILTRAMELIRRPDR